MLSGDLTPTAGDAYLQGRRSVGLPCLNPGSQIYVMKLVLLVFILPTKLSATLTTVNALHRSMPIFVLLIENINTFTMTTLSVRESISLNIALGRYFPLSGILGYNSKCLHSTNSITLSVSIKCRQQLNETKFTATHWPCYLA